MDALKNGAFSTVATPPSPPTTGTTLVVKTGHGARFAAPPFNASVWPDPAIPDASNTEVVRVTGIAGDTLTILRAQEGSGARAILAGDQVSAAITAKTITDIGGRLDGHDTSLASHATTLAAHDTELGVHDAALTLSDPWHRIGDSGQPAFTTGFQHYPAAAWECYFRKTQLGRVYMRGLVYVNTTISVPTTIFTLPAGYRPLPSDGDAHALLFGPPMYNGAYVMSRVDVAPNGTVQYAAPLNIVNGNWFSIAPIHFQAEH